ncbi:adenosylcobinamide-GDP ribazoletransferase [Natroniella acetigena]|uniref:adenosylcobinamide-GDP ribazoletransferase n=1 Tax=Natroniella acetigena TaxID=52004 RepID=UPI00200A42F3|nr:adenosylcobinamide-GDP ribazoletransferase [Natroniella acetigena]MCK8826483.1 adenosylcobinamide-GDP ribazoletransferase [Natroniella acetigena]
MNRFLIALQFITRIPVMKELDYKEENIGSSMLYFPVIGSLLGLLLVGINYIGELYLPELVTNSLLLGGMVALTGGIHLDGLMDTCDGIFSGRQKERVLEIMKDSRVGAFGVIGLVVLFILKFSLFVEVPTVDKGLLLLYFPTISRWAMVYAAFHYPYARQEGLGKAHVEYLTTTQFLLATAWTMVLGIILFGVTGIVVYLISWLAVILIAKIIINQIDGLTGDSYGAINELMEVASLLIMVILV